MQQNKRFNFSIIAAAVFALTVLFIPVGDAFAQTQVPIFGDFPLAVIETGPGDWKAAPVELLDELEQCYGGTASVMLCSALIGAMDSASSGSTLRLEGGWAADDAAEELDARGYTVETSVAPRLSGASVAYVYSD